MMTMNTRNKHDANCMTTNADETRQRDRPRKTWWDCFRKIWKVWACPERIHSLGADGLFVWGLTALSAQIGYITP